MKIISIICIIITFIYGIFEMKKSSQVTKGDEYNSLGSKDKKLIVQKLKNHWKIFIILLSMLFAMALIILSTYMGKGTSYDSVIAIVNIIISVAIIIFMTIKSKKFKDEIK